MRDLFSLTVEIVSDQMVIEGNTYPLGHFTVEYLNNLQEGAVIEQMKNVYPSDRSIWDPLKDWCLTKHEFVELGEESIRFLDLLTEFPPYDTYDYSDAKAAIEQTFTVGNYKLISDWKKQLHHTGIIDVDTISLSEVLDFTYDLPEHTGIQPFREATEVIDSILDMILDCDDMDIPLKWFTKMTSDIEKVNRDDLAIIASLNSISMPNDVTTKYKVRINDDFTFHICRVLTFEDYGTFLLTDFYEGIMQNHYPRRCPVCGRVFLMEKAYRQKYCTGNAPLELTGGRVFTCADWALRKESGFQKEAAEASEAKRIYTNTTGSIRKYKSLGTITAEQAQAATRLAEEKRDEAIRNKEYAAGAYPDEMIYSNLMEEVRNGAEKNH